MNSKEAIAQFIYERNVLNKGTINEMMQFSLIHFDEKEQCLSLRFPVQPWQVNPMGHMHGGMIATAFDMAMGCLAFGLKQGSYHPTLDMNIRYLSGISVDKQLEIKVYATHVGRAIIQVEAKAYIENKPHIMASASGSYFIHEL